jgi:hypothetical protein
LLMSRYSGHGQCISGMASAFRAWPVHSGMATAASLVSHLVNKQDGVQYACKQANPSIRGDEGFLRSLVGSALRRWDLMRFCNDFF